MSVKIPSDIPLCEVMLAFFDSSKYQARAGRPITAQARDDMAMAIRDANPDLDTETDIQVDGPTATGCECDCRGRDSNEIPLYLTIDELHAVDQIMQRITFGDLTNDDDIVQIHRAQKEIRETGQRHLR